MVHLMRHPVSAAFVSSWVQESRDGSDLHELTELYLEAYEVFNGELEDL
jgi:hypothetical protein